MCMLETFTLIIIMNLPDASTRHTITKLPIRLINCNSTELRLCFVFLLLLTTTTLFFVLIWQYEPTWTPFPKPIQFVLTENESTIDIKYKPFPKNFIIQTLSPIPNLPAIDFQLKQIVNFSQKQLKIRTFKTQIEKLVQQKFNRTTNEFPVLFERINRGYCYQGFRANDTHLTLTIVIKSRLDDFKRRHHIRNSWGWKERKLINVKLNVLFAIGSCAFIDASCEQAIQTEQDDHGDLIQGDFKDTYNNNTLKTIMIFKWFNDYCAKTSDYLLIVDDDFYVSIKNLIIHITQTSFEDKKMPSELKSDILGPQFDPREKHLYSGFVIRNSAPFRDPNNKWFVSYQEYPFLRYPDYITGGFTLYSRRTAIELWLANFYQDRFRIDDVYIGLLARSLGIKPIDMPGCYFWITPKVFSLFKHMICLHNLPVEIQYAVWNTEYRLGNV